MEHRELYWSVDNRDGKFVIKQKVVKSLRKEGILCERRLGPRSQNFTFRGVLPIILLAIIDDYPHYESKCFVKV